MGITTWGKICSASKSAAAKVLLVSSYTRKLKAKFPAMPPAAPKMVATVTNVKFLVHNVFFMLFTSRLSYNTS